MHSYVLTGRDTTINLPLLDWLGGRWPPGRALFPGGGTALGYALAALLFLGAKCFTVPRARRMKSPDRHCLNKKITRITITDRQ